MKPRIRSLALLPSLAIVGIGLVLPGLLMLAYSFLRYVPGRITDFTLSIENYLRLFGDFFYLGVVVRTLQLALSSLCCRCCWRIRSPTTSPARRRASRAC
jgi:putative spermidine/putrescine transport system permease protein